MLLLANHVEGRIHTVAWKVARSPCYQEERAFFCRPSDPAKELGKALPQFPRWTIRILKIEKTSQKELVYNRRQKSVTAIKCASSALNHLYAIRKKLRWLSQKNRSCPENTYVQTATASLIAFYSSTGSCSTIPIPIINFSISVLL